MAKANSRRPTLEGVFLVISFANGKIDGEAFYRGSVVDAYRGGRSRAFVAGSKKCQVYQLGKRDDGALEFTRIEK